MNSPFVPIQILRKIKNVNMNVQLPAHFVIKSAALCPTVFGTLIVVYCSIGTDFFLLASSLFFI